MDILILGGTQFVGKHIVVEALSRNHNITLFNRGISNPELFSDTECINGDRNNDIDLKNLAKHKWDVVIDVPYFPVETVKKSVDILDGSVDKYVFISTVGVYDIDKNYDVGSPWAGRWYAQYCKDKLESERLFNGKELKSLIFRPGIICGDDDNTHRFDYTDNGIFWKNTNKEVEKYVTAGDFSIYVLDLIEMNVDGIYEII